jgi:hypothetical protein
MKRQCAWCLRLMNNAGEHLSPTPLPKLYDATHGICGVCGMRWMEQAMGSQDVTSISIQLRSRMAESAARSFPEQKTTAGAR